MGLFDLFKRNETASTEKKSRIPWIPLISADELDTLVSKSSKRPQLIFKNSTTCGISSMALRSFEAQYDLNSEQADLYMLHIQHNRPLSNEIAQRFRVRHESPQLLIIKNGSVVKEASHGVIAEVSIEKYL
ncbi:bacillithiol system redox-active protein YtxJ [uncultured Muriicola sp.]|uniref:bacillithiol system redox-active protein YtxJ n=1 Tax=uncultured Muriicola sp. TaxID=1583102 RepID=UPI002634311B|nr:bacillithiol system redox-active protein YtxJ [uncultured Muriicola sp.]